MRHSDFIMDKQLKVSIIIVCLNDRDFFGCTIESVISQIYEKKEIIVIDGGSTDGTIEEISKYKDRINVFISEPDDGIYDAMNKGISYASGDIIYFLNCGDYILDKDVISKVVKIFSKKQNYGVIYGDTIEYNLSGAQVYKKNFQKSIIHLITRCGICHQAIFAKREVFDINEKMTFNTKYKVFSDYDWLLDIVLKKQIESIYVDFPVCYYLMGGFSQSNYLDYSCERLQIIFKNFKKLINLKLIVEYPKEYLYLIIIILWLNFFGIRTYIHSLAQFRNQTNNALK